jgi:hypothetical protein
MKNKNQTTNETTTDPAPQPAEVLAPQPAEVLAPQTAAAIVGQGYSPLLSVRADLDALVLAGAVDLSSLPVQTVPSLALPLVQVDRPASAAPRWWTRSEELRGYPTAAPSRRQLDPGGEEGWTLGPAVRLALLAYRERWELRDDEGLVEASALYQPGRKRRGQVLAALPVADELAGARWVLVTLTAGGLAASTLRTAYVTSVKARRSVLKMSRQNEALAVLLPGELLAGVSDPKPIPGNLKGEKYVHSVIKDSGLILSPAQGLAELLADERALVEEWSAGVEWVAVKAGARDTTPDDGGDDIPFGQSEG